MAPVLLDVYESWGKLGTISVTSRIGIIPATYKKGDKRNIENYRPTSTYTIKSILQFLKVTSATKLFFAIK